MFAHKRGARQIYCRMGLKGKIAAVLFAAFMISAPLWTFGVKAQSQPPSGYKGVLTLWHVDGFEGGSGSRATFLNNRAMEFENLHEGVLVSVQTYTSEQVRQKLADGDRFDLISFPVGTGQYLKERLDVYSSAVNVRGDLLGGGTLSGDIYALPWTYGGYALCAFDKSVKGKSIADGLADGSLTLGVGFWQYGNPIEALKANGISVAEGTWNKDSSLTSYGAYEGFLAGRFDVLLATQRDISRLKLRQSQGRLESMTTVYLGGFTDLTQYIGYSDNGDGRGEYAAEFIKFLTSDACQRKLTAIEMFSPALSVYTSGAHADMEKVLSKPLGTVNVFTDGGQIDEAKRQNEKSLAEGL